MPLDRLVLIVVVVVAAAATTVFLGVFLGVFLAAWVSLPPLAALVVVPVVLAGYVIWRVIAERLNNAEDDHYDGIER
jgi:hypothetical protein